MSGTVKQKRVAKVKLPQPSEHESQVAFFQRVRLDPRTKHLPIFAIPNGGARHIVTAKKLKAEGVSAGVPDIFVAAPMMVKRQELTEDGYRTAYDTYHGLFIEMKRKGNYRTPSQLEWANALEARDYRVEVCYSADAAWQTLCEYLGFNPNG